MTTQDVTYRIRVRIFHSDNEDHFVNMNEFSNGSEEVRKQWVEKITDHIWGSQYNSSLGSIRPWDFILAPDGSVESLPVSQIEGESSGMYPAHYRIPPTSIDWSGRNKPTARNALLSRLYFTKSVLERSPSNGSAVMKSSSVTAMPSSQTMSELSHLSSLPSCHFGVSSLPI